MYLMTVGETFSLYAQTHGWSKILPLGKILLATLLKST